MSVAAKTATGRGGVTPAGEKREKGGENVGLSSCLFRKRRRERGLRGRGRRSSASIPWKLARGVAGPGRDDGDDGRGGLERSGDTGGRRGLRRGRGLTARRLASRPPRRAHARGKQRATRRFGRRQRERQRER